MNFVRFRVLKVLQKVIWDHNAVLSTAGGESISAVAAPATAEVEVTLEEFYRNRTANRFPAEYSRLRRGLAGCLEVYGRGITI